MLQIPTLGQIAAERRRDPSGAARSIAGLLLLSHAMRRLGQRDFDLAEVRREPSARPRCPRDISFSISHSEALVACALSTTARPIGLDVEHVRPIAAGDFELYLSDDERAHAGHDAQRFFALWTRKESVVKAHGAGLARLSEVELDGHRARFDGTQWVLCDVDLAAGYRAALALLDDGRQGGALPRPITYELSLEELETSAERYADEQPA